MQWDPTLSVLISKLCLTELSSLGSKGLTRLAPVGLACIAPDMARHACMHACRAISGANKLLDAFGPFAVLYS